MSDLIAARGRGLARVSDQVINQDIQGRGPGTLRRMMRVEFNVDFAPVGAKLPIVRISVPLALETKWKKLLQRGIFFRTTVDSLGYSYYYRVGG